MPFRSLSLDELTIDDEASFAHVSLYRDLSRILRRSGHRFLVPAAGAAGGVEGGSVQTESWDRVVFLNLAFWSPEERADALCEDRIPADVVAHVAWHHLAALELGRRAPGPASAEALLFAEAIASGFDLYLLGRLLPNVPDSDFVTSQLPAMADAARNAGLSDEAFAALAESIAAGPERAFEELRELLFDVATSLVGCRGIAEADRVLARFADHRFEPLLHHFELSNWILYARAHGARPGEPDEAVRAIDRELRAAPDAIAWLERAWVAPALAAGEE